MFHAPIRAFAALLLPLVLMGCMLAPGKFTSVLTINADRSFRYTYSGEVYVMDLAKQMAAGLSRKADGSKGDAATEAKNRDELDRKARAIAAALGKEAGYRKVEYVGEGKFVVDYAIDGRLTHHFVYPFNLDAEAIIPFIAVELRADGKVRVMAPAFGRESTISGTPSTPSEAGPGAKLDGIFTIDTDAEVVSQNNEGGVENAGARKRITWRVTPMSKQAPMAVLGLAGK